MIPKAALGRLEPIAKGGVGQVYRLPDHRPSGRPSLAYKEVLASCDETTRTAALAAMSRSVAFRTRLSPADRDNLDRYGCWPIDLVEDGGVPCGLVMPLLPPDFFLCTTPVTGPSTERVFDLQWLSASERLAQVEGVDRAGVRDVVVRIALLAKLVYAVGRLHRHGAVYGDLSLRNAALALRPPRVKLLDCDGAAALDDPTRVQLHSPFFTPPEIASGAQKLQDHRTDVYKLGLCIIRGLQQGPGVTQASDPAPLARVLDGEAVDLVARAVHADPTRRPTAKELYAGLERSLLARTSPPTLHRAALSRLALLRGQDVEVTWEAAGGARVRILGSNGLEVTLSNPPTTPGRHVVTPIASGPVVVEVGNAHGTVQLTAGSVTLYDLPRFTVDTSFLPRPVVQALPVPASPPAMSALRAAPAVSTAAHPVPRPVVPALDPVADCVSALGTVVAPAERIDSAVVGATRSVRGALDVENGGDLGVAARALRNARSALDASWQDLRDRAHRQRSARRQREGTP